MNRTGPGTGRPMGPPPPGSRRAATPAAALLQTKFHPPQGAAVVPRPRLIDLMERSRDRKLALVTAPAGYGKTTLLSQWRDRLAGAGHRAAWLSLDSDDNDLGRFALCLIEAIRAVAPAFGAAIRPSLLSGAPASIEWLSTALLQEVTQLNDDIHLFIDDYQVMTDPVIAKIMSETLRRSGPQLHLVIASRDVPFLPLARLRMLGQLLEITWEELRFSAAETAIYFSSPDRPEIPRAVADGLNAKTEGWIAGLQLAAISLQGQRDPVSFFQEFSGQNRSVAEFLAQDVLATLPDDLRDFLLKTSVLTRLTPDLCDAVTGRTDSRAMLDQIEARRLFLFALDTSGDWYRYHHLFSEFLGKTLARRDPTAPSALRRAASRWCRDNGLVAEAVEYAFAAEAPEDAATILSVAHDTMWRYGPHATFVNLVNRLPDRLARPYPLMRLYYAFGLLLQWRFTEVENILAEIGHALASGEFADDDPATVRERLWFIDAMLAMFRDDPVTAGTLGRRWFDKGCSPDPYLNASIEVLLSWARREQFDLDYSKQAEIRVEEGARQSASPNVDIWWHHIAGQTWLYGGDLERAEKHLRRSVAVATDVGGPGSAVAAMSGTVLAALAYERDDIASAEALLATYLPLALGYGLVQQHLDGHLTAARIAFLRGDEEQSRENIERAIATGRARRYPRLVIGAIGERIRQTILAGDLTAAFRAGKAENLLGSIGEYAPGPGATRVDEMRAVARLRLAVAEGAYGDAVKLARNWLRFIGERQAISSRVLFHTLAATALAHRDERLAAEREMRQAVTLAAPYKLKRIFLDEGEPAGGLLANIAGKQFSTGSAGPFIGRILETPGKDDGRAAGPVRSPGAADGEFAAEPLSDREMQVLGLVASGLGNDEIAEELSLSRNTVKWHMRQIFDKLGVRQRFQAVRRAQRLGYLGRRPPGEAGELLARY